MAILVELLAGQMSENLEGWAVLQPTLLVPLCCMGSCNFLGMWPFILLRRLEAGGRHGSRH